MLKANLSNHLRVITLMLASMTWSTLVISAEESPNNTNPVLISAGKRIYREGILSSGQPLEGIAMGDISMVGAQAACENCHRRSGMGASEAGQRALPLAGTVLFQPGPPNFWYLHDIIKPGENRFRPAYTDITLARVIREGLSSSGRSLQSSMPRFNLADADVTALSAYLKSLTDVSPAVDEHSIHWATIVTPDADPAEKKAMLDVMETFFKERNAETNRYLHNGHIPANRGYAPLRHWELDVWELQGPPATWGAQLEARYLKRPVFAVLGGIGGANWQPVHDFCESQALACLFPNTMVPIIKTDDFYSVYFSKGLILEAESLAEFLRSTNLHQQDRIVQLYRKGSKGEVAATALRNMMLANGAVGLNDREIKPNEKINAAFWRKLIKSKQPRSLILWLNEKDLTNLEFSGKLYFSGHLLKGRIPKSLNLSPGKVFLVSPWGNEQSRTERFNRMRSWMETKGVAVTDELLQGNVLWLMWLVDEAVEQITHHFSPDYLIERIEDMMGNLSNLSLYPRISLGSKQRFAAKGCFILVTGKDGKLTSADNLIVPP